MYHEDHVIQPPAPTNRIIYLQSEKGTPTETAHRQIWREKLCCKTTAYWRIPRFTSLHHHCCSYRRTLFYSILSYYCV